MDERREQSLNNYIHWGFQSLLLGLVTWGVTELSGVNKSVQELNVKMAVVVTKDEVRASDIESLKARMSRLEYNEKSN